RARGGRDPDRLHPATVGAGHRRPRAVDRAPPRGAPLRRRRVAAGAGRSRRVLRPVRPAAAAADRASAARDPQEIRRLTSVALLLAVAGALGGCPPLVLGTRAYPGTKVSGCSRSAPSSRPGVKAVFGVAG